MRGHRKYQMKNRYWEKLDSQKLRGKCILNEPQHELVSLFDEEDRLSGLERRGGEEGVGWGAGQREDRN